MGHTSHAVFAPSSSVAAQHPVIWPYFGFPVPPADSNCSIGSESGDVLMKASATRPASSAASGFAAATAMSGGSSGSEYSRACSTSKYSPRWVW